MVLFDVHETICHGKVATQIPTLRGAIWGCRLSCFGSTCQRTSVIIGLKGSGSQISETAEITETPFIIASNRVALKLSFDMFPLSFGCIPFGMFCHD